MSAMKHFIIACLLVAHAALADTTFTYQISLDTYLDSANPTRNYGLSGSDKVVINSTSACRTLFDLPTDLWSYSPGSIESASVSFYVWQDNTGTLNITLYPLTRSFVQGTGSGTAPTDGATWLTYDGTHPWTNPGGDFDPVCPVVGVKGDILDPDLNDRFFYWDITELLKTAASRTELQNYGAILRIDETPVPATGMPRAPFTSSYDPSYPPAYWPSLQLTIRPTVFNVTVSGGSISLGISNLTDGVTNIIERSFDLTTNGWTAVTNFVATGNSTNWSEAIQPGWTNAFYRVHSEE